MAHLSSKEIAKYVNSPVHYAVACHDYAALGRIISTLPRLVKVGEIRTESDSIAEEQRADILAAVLDRRDVPHRETPLHLAVRLGDAVAAEILVAAGADWSLQNERGWSALQEAVCAREDSIAMTILKHYQPMAWAKWCRRLPRVIATMKRMRDFYLELTFHFESSVIPFIGRIAPSDTYRIWKRGSNLRADMTLAGFDGFRIQRSDQSFIFLGEGSADGKLPPGYLCMLSHKNKEVMNALEGAGTQPSEAEIAQEVAAMLQTNMYRPGIDVTQAELIPHMTWRRHEKTEMVGAWKAKVYDMHHVMLSVKSRRVPGAMTDEELFGTVEKDREDGDVDEDFTELLTQEEKQQLETALKLESLETDECPVDGDEEIRLSSASGLDQNTCIEPFFSSKDKKKGWFSWGRKSVNIKHDGGKKITPPRNSLCFSEKVSNLLGDSPQPDGDLFRKSPKFEQRQRSVDSRPSNIRADEGLMFRKGREASRKSACKEGLNRRRVTPSNDGSTESEYKRGLRPVLWLTPHFPLKTEELLPLLDILANKVKAVRRLRELLTTKMPADAFPVKIAIPVVPTIKVLVTFTKFEELHPNEEFATPPTSPEHVLQNEKSKVEISWFSWIKGSASKVVGMAGIAEDHSNEVVDPFIIPSDYVWTSMDTKRQRGKDSVPKGKKGRKTSVDAVENGDGG